MQVVLKPTFSSVRFDSSMCYIYSTKDKVEFFGDALEYIIIFMLYFHTCIFH
jgi:hypothetical protein